MPQLDHEKLRCYLERVHGEPVDELSLHRLGEAESTEEKPEKEYGYGRPVLLEYHVAGEARRAVLHTMAPGPFGHEHAADRAAIWLWSHSAFNRLPRHVPSLDVGAFRRDGTLASLGETEEFFLLTGFADGVVYAQDMRQLRQRDEPSDRALARCDILSDYLAEIHSQRHDDRQLYNRRIRELVGHGECIMGLTDSYPPDHPVAPPDRLEAIEHQALRWRWKLKDRAHRLRRVHGDFHPWNILFDESNELWVLDRSRGEYGDGADDVVSLAMNYLFESLQARGNLSGAFRTLFHRLWRRYLDHTDDEEMLEVAAPFIAFRGLVQAHPLWYPYIDPEVREKLLRFVERNLEADRFDPERVDEQLEPA